MTTHENDLTLLVLMAASHWFGQDGVESPRIMQWLKAMGEADQKSTEAFLDPRLSGMLRIVSTLGIAITVAMLSWGGPKLLETLAKMQTESIETRFIIQQLVRSNNDQDTKINQLLEIRLELMDHKRRLRSIEDWLRRKGSF